MVGPRNGEARREQVEGDGEVGEEGQAAPTRERDGRIGKNGMVKEERERRTERLSAGVDAL